MSVTKANRDIKSLQPIAQKACELFLNECKKKNIPNSEYSLSLSVI